MSLLRPHPSGDSAQASPSDDRHSGLSAAADGDADALGAACLAWRDDAAARSTWHAYHLIGDVLRSGELATTPQRDAAFLRAFQLVLERYEAELDAAREVDYSDMIARAARHVESRPQLPST